MATSEIEGKYLWKSGTYSNITVPSSNYIQIDSYSNLGVDSTKYKLASAMIKGWSGATPRGIVLGSNGTGIYLIGNNGSVTSLGVEYCFLKI